jgi:hypothetical protein
MTKIKIGDSVIKNESTWVPNDFDSWGRGVGIGEVVDIVDGDIDVRWPGGRCYEIPESLIKINL